ncbi:MAG: hypothetical protein E6J60_16205 [Deltaproteobacteria bacterium]|nr:MAG: hypothetical protein E6J60_16205 [Deltaproteobacteria bacterium]
MDPGAGLESRELAATDDTGARARHGLPVARRAAAATGRHIGGQLAVELHGDRRRAAQVLDQDREGRGPGAHGLCRRYGTRQRQQGKRVQPLPHRTADEQEPYPQPALSRPARRALSRRRALLRLWIVRVCKPASFLWSRAAYVSPSQLPRGARIRLPRALGGGGTVPRGACRRSGRGMLERVTDRSPPCSRPVAPRWPVALVVVTTLASLLAGNRPAPTAPSPARQPNILFILTDDLDLREVSVMPHLRSLVGARGATFRNFFVSVSLCCPSRSTCLRGQYSHNTHVLTNKGTTGGFETAHALGLEQSTVATWLHDAGYRTALIGKYLNGYPNSVSDAYVPPGWDEWDSPSQGSPYSEFNYTLNENGTQVAYGGAVADYGTDVYARKAAEFITEAARRQVPFFVYLAVYAPHLPATPAPRDAGLFPGARAPRSWPRPSSAPWTRSIGAGSAPSRRSTTRSRCWSAP